jgi:hypothetical protein
MASLPKPNRRLAVAAVVAAAVVAQLPALRAGYALDDDTLLVSNPYVRTLSGLRVLVTQEFFFASARPELSAQYRPVSGALNWLSWQLLGGSAPAQHALNIALHAAVATCLLFSLEALGASRVAALLATVLFAVHPVATMNVGYVEGRQDLLGWVFVLGGVLAMTRQRSLVAIAVTSGVATLLAAHCREVFAGTFVWLAATALARGERPRQAAVAALAGGAPALLVIALLRRAVGVTGYESPPSNAVELFRAATASALRLCRDVVWPFDLSLLVTPVSLSAALALLAALALAAGAFGVDRVLATRAPKARPLAWTCFAVIAVSSAAYSLVVTRLGPLSDRYAYAAVLAACFLLAALAQALPPSLPSAVTMVPGALALALLPTTWARGVTFRDESTLQRTMEEEIPDDPETQIATGLRLLAQGDVEGAYPHCQAYASTHPPNSRADRCIGIWLLLHGRSCEALTRLRPYALARPGFPAARRPALAAAFACNDLPAVRSMLDAWEPIAPGADDLVEARQQLEARGDR